MKKTLSTILMAGIVILMTAGFSFAEYATGGADNFPYFQLGCLIIGGLIMMSLKHKFHKIYTSEVIGAFALYTLYVSLFTSPVMEAVKNLIG
jgi:Gpi18-like mannosyltransferase